MPVHRNDSSVRESVDSLNGQKRISRAVGLRPTMQFNEQNVNVQRTCSQETARISRNSGFLAIAVVNVATLVSDLRVSSAGKMMADYGERNLSTCSLSHDTHRGYLTLNTIPFCYELATWHRRRAYNEAVYSRASLIRTHRSAILVG